MYVWPHVYIIYIYYIVVRHSKQWRAACCTWVPNQVQFYRCHPMHLYSHQCLLVWVHLQAGCTELQRAVECFLCHHLHSHQDPTEQFEMHKKDKKRRRNNIKISIRVGTLVVKIKKQHNSSSSSSSSSIKTISTEQQTNLPLLNISIDPHCH